MTAAESELLARLVTRLDKLVLSATSDLEWLGNVPPDLAAFEAMPMRSQSAARAVLKSFEQTEDQLSRAFRALPKLVGTDSARWFARDHADFVEGLGILDDAAVWGGVVRLRNELVHDYPLDPQVQFDRLVSAIEYLPLLGETHRRLAAYIRDELPGKTI